MTFRGTCDAGEFCLDAVDGSSFKASLNGPGVEPALVEVTGPGGTVAAVVSGDAGSAKVTAVLDQGTGIYVVRFPATGEAAVAWSVKPPKGATLAE